MRLLAMTVATCAALTVGADAARAGDTSGHHATMAVMGSGHAAQATLVRHRGYSSHHSGRGSHHGRGSAVIQRYYSHYPNAIYRSHGYRSHGRGYYPSHGRRYRHGYSYGGLHYGFGISLGF